MTDLTARQWIERARNTLDERTRIEDDTQLIDAHDDLCNALEVINAPLFIAECNAPGGVTLRAYSSDERRARLALARGWRAHYAQLNATIEPRLNPNDVNVRKCELDHCYRDGIDFNGKLT